MDAVPQGVIEGLAEVRERGETNMLDRRVVIELCGEYGYLEAVEWLTENRDRYMDALNAMGEYVSGRDD